MDCYYLSTSCGSLSLTWIRRLFTKIVNGGHFNYTTVAGNRKVWLVNQVYNTSWIDVVTQLDHPMFVSNRCVMEIFGGVFVFLFCSLLTLGAVS